MGGASGLCDLAYFCHVPVGIDVKLRCSRKFAFVLSWMNTITRADVHARSILCAHTRFGNYVCHSTLLGAAGREARLVLYRERRRFLVEKAMPPQERRIESCGK